ncbi:pyridoxamine 5'-phosphate oxidase family protein [Planomonospora venezuelensis]|uniref:Nitroimidazol reductase NimA-like FMN-containing flavoprotein (Pyridoxamine 5'-phosphate oxidase superfamily) n=1 Tax=Planomonospora venezuelensis TaxID=1999 RepID=A0A841DKS2_PLAVE|nr:pyridoxamine 5'-phosphate oxidase family protein [Planomonospora venezuelensis]MBB5967706.1 nitroimidazol reductase NimA-like FMN-containing flavoprotein (pyridoxamine 5'-phosphate oxidase superfamily) [Planomonospora venezuelensis]
MKVDSTGLRVLSRAECLELLASAPIGRIVFTDRALPAVQPVNYMLDGERLVVRARAGSKLALAVRDAVVALEADAFDPAGRTGWSVTVVGHAHAVPQGRESSRLAHLPLAPWTPRDGQRPDGRDHYIVLPVEQISGRRVETHP